MIQLEFNCNSTWIRLKFLWGQPRNWKFLKMLDFQVLEGPKMLKLHVSRKIWGAMAPPPQPPLIQAREWFTIYVYNPRWLGGQKLKKIVNVLVCSCKCRGGLGFKNLLKHCKRKLWMPPGAIFLNQAKKSQVNHNYGTFPLKSRNLFLQMWQQ